MIISGKLCLWHWMIIEERNENQISSEGKIQCEITENGYRQYQKLLHITISRFKNEVFVNFFSVWFVRSGGLIAGELFPGRKMSHLGLIWAQNEVQ